MRSPHAGNDSQALFVDLASKENDVLAEIEPGRVSRIGIWKLGRPGMLFPHAHPRFLEQVQVLPLLRIALDLVNPNLAFSEGVAAQFAKDLTQRGPARLRDAANLVSSAQNCNAVTEDFIFLRGPVERLRLGLRLFLRFSIT